MTTMPRLDFDNEVTKTLVCTDDEVTTEVRVLKSVAPATVEIDEDAFDSASIEHLGWCPSCLEFTTPGVLAKEYRRECVDCADDRVCGVGHAVRNGFVTVNS